MQSVIAGDGDPSGAAPGAQPQVRVPGDEPHLAHGELGGRAGSRYHRISTGPRFRRSRSPRTIRLSDGGDDGRRHLPVDRRGETWSENFAGAEIALRMITSIRIFTRPGPPSNPQQPQLSTRALCTVAATGLGRVPVRRSCFIRRRVGADAAGLLARVRMPGARRLRVEGCGRRQASGRHVPVLRVRDVSTVPGICGGRFRRTDGRRQGVRSSRAVVQPGQHPGGGPVRRANISGISRT